MATFEEYPTPADPEGAEYAHLAEALRPDWELLDQHHWKQSLRNDQDDDQLDGRWSDEAETAAFLYGEHPKTTKLREESDSGGVENWSPSSMPAPLSWPSGIAPRGQGEHRTILSPLQTTQLGETARQQAEMPPSHLNLQTVNSAQNVGEYVQRNFPTYRKSVLGNGASDYFHSTSNTINPDRQYRSNTRSVVSLAGAVTPSPVLGPIVFPQYIPGTPENEFVTNTNKSLLGKAEQFLRDLGPRHSPGNAFRGVPSSNPSKLAPSSSNPPPPPGHNSSSPWDWVVLPAMIAAWLDEVGKSNGKREREKLRKCFTDSKGKRTIPDHWEAHHIIPIAYRELDKARYIMQQCGIGISDCMNGIALPNSRKAAAMEGDILHSDVHQNRHYVDFIRGAVDKIIEDCGQPCSLSQICRSMRNLIDRIAYDLSHQRLPWLNQ